MQGVDKVRTFSHTNVINREGREGISGDYSLCLPNTGNIELPVSPKAPILERGEMGVQRGWITKRILFKVGG